MTENEIGKIIINYAFKVHKESCPGLFESTYEVCLLSELSVLLAFFAVKKTIAIA